MRKGKENRKTRLGVVGLARGMTDVEMAPKVGMEVVALCDIREERVKKVGKEVGVAAYTEFDKFLEHEMDAVVLANYFHEHAPLAIKALAAGKHVLSQIAACKTVGEGVELARAVEKSGKIYMITETNAYFAFIQEMRRLYRAGEVGEMQFGECEYIHSCSADDLNSLAPGMNHWRNHIPSTYYPNHAIGPIMYVTDAMPVSVNAQSIAFSSKDKQNLHVRRGDQGAVIVCRMDNGAVVTINGILLRGRGDWFRIHGTRGLMENCRTRGDQGKLRIVHEEWDMKPGDVREKIYAPRFPVMEELAWSAGHGGGDFFVEYFFAEAIRKNEQPWFDVYRGLAMAAVGIQAWRSCLANGAPFEIPDFRDEEVRKKYGSDNWSPFPEDRGPGQPPPSIKGWIKPSAKQKAAARKMWVGSR